MDPNSDFDFTNLAGAAKPATAAAGVRPAVAERSKFYNPAVAQKLFELGGSRERMAEGGVFFSENDKHSKGGLFSKAVVNKMFFIAAGEVALTVGGKTLDTIGAGEIFGEMSVITGAPRSATASADRKSVV